MLGAIRNVSLVLNAGHQGCAGPNGSVEQSVPMTHQVRSAIAFDSVWPPLFSSLQERRNIIYQFLKTDEGGHVVQHLINTKVMLLLAREYCAPCKAARLVGLRDLVGHGNTAKCTACLLPHMIYQIRITQHVRNPITRVHNQNSTISSGYILAQST